MAKAEVEPEGEPVEGEEEGEGEGEQEPEALGVEADAKGEPQVPEGFQLCPLCAGAGAVPEDVRGDPNSQPCTVCRGYGKLVTGSLVAQHAIIDCEDCRATGYVTRLRQAPAARAAPSSEYGPPAAGSVLEEPAPWRHQEPAEPASY